jgi:hypothetical protein
MTPDVTESSMTAASATVVPLVRFAGHGRRVVFLVLANVAIAGIAGLTNGLLTDTGASMMVRVVASITAGALAFAAIVLAGGAGRPHIMTLEIRGLGRAPMRICAPKLRAEWTRPDAQLFAPPDFEVAPELWSVLCAVLEPAFANADEARPSLADRRGATETKP